MKRVLLFFVVSSSLLFSCKKEDVVQKQSSISEKVLTQIKEMGFSIKDIQSLPEGYLVEGDILLTKEALESTAKTRLLRVGDEEQYRTTNVVGGLPRGITVSINGLPAAYTNSLDIAIQRYNAENLALTFTRVAGVGQINFAGAPAGATYLASAGFPSNGNPFGQVLVNAAAIGAAPNADYLATILAHEMGHCIGYRHTDYANRSYSCGGAASNEGASNVGAIQVPGTPAAPDPNSWMLACIGAGVNRPFNANDITALNNLYRRPPVAGTVPVYRYYGGNSDHFYTSNYNELQGGPQGGYNLEGVGFYTFPYQAAGTSPVYRYYSGSQGDHFYTANYAELGAGGAYGYGYEGIAFYVYTTQVAGTVPVYRYYSQAQGDHFYTANYAELGAGGAYGYVYEGIAFYAYQ